MLLKHFFLIGSLVFAAAGISACKTESAPKAPTKKNSLDARNEEGLDEGTAEAGEEGEETPEGTPFVESTEPLSLEISDASDLKAKLGAPLSITFNIKGAGSKDVQVGMMSSPSGTTVEVSGSTVTFKWQTPTGGTYPLKFLLRDQTKCEDKASASACKISNSETGLTAKSYDVASKEFSLEVETDDSLGLPGTGAGSGGNDQLIQQITALLGGGGGGAGGVQDLLKGLSGGQLQTLLGQLKNGGGGGGIGQLIGLLGN